MARVLLFTRTTDVRHDSIEHASQVVTAMLRTDGHDVVTTEDAAAFHVDALTDVALTV